MVCVEEGHIFRPGWGNQQKKGRLCQKCKRVCNVTWCVTGHQTTQ